MPYHYADGSQSDTHGHLTPPPVPHGPGTELRRLLSRLGIHDRPGCACRSTAARMDAQGPAWCREHEAEILAVLEAEARKRGLPWHPLPARLLLRLALRRAERRALQAACTPDAQPPHR